MLVSLTAEGKRLIAENAGEVGRRVRALTANLSARDRDRLTELAGSVVRAAT
ncbi:hypothetical protein [Amycolatopsis acidicola]|uniref:hypothetical protein n=1 Tax=Amycolatopsis acidicola TaxID=2596893 RepID=UPI00140C2471|nr:hypothetical protein [Amycolatopsis acidicola]